MTPIYVACATCRGCGYVHPPPAPHAWLRCPTCDGIGKAWAPGGPLFGCTMTLAERKVGEVVSLGTGDRCRITRQTPKKHPTVTFVRMFEGDFGDDEHESDSPIALPSELGVAGVGIERQVDSDDGFGEKGADLGDPLYRNYEKARGRLL